MKEMKESRKTRYTRMVLQNSLVQLMEQKPISKISVKDICEKADINRSTFYSHYTDKYDLMWKIEVETLSWAEEMINTLLAETEKDETLKVLEGILHSFTDQNNHINILMSEQGDIDFQKKVLTLIYRQCDIAPPSTNKADLVNRELYFIFVVNGSVGLIQHWLKNGLKIPVSEMAEIIYNMASQIQ